MYYNIETLCNSLAEKLGPCEKCGYVPAVLAVFADNDSDEIVGFKVVCGCNGKKEYTQDEIAGLKTYTVEELSEIIKNKEKI